MLFNVHPEIDKTPILGIVVFLVIECLVPPAGAEIFTYIDQSGNLHFTNRPVSSVHRVYVSHRPSLTLADSIPDRYDAIIDKAGRRFNLSRALLKAIIKVESDYNPRAVSRSGAQGLMQIMPANQRALELGDPFDPDENIMAGARYLSKLVKQYQGKLLLALAAYNAGPTRVSQTEFPPFSETRNFVKRVMRYYYSIKRQLKKRSSEG
ncbi:MAG: lytic transglycosylase domain-containing protein [Deltaproteobacteria bacterium]|nr:lytic transglycosylase domain-containing protein [Deltaproteobacteria bacterium]